MQQHAVKEAIQAFICNTFIYAEDTVAGISESTDLINDGVVDSFGVQEIVAFLEERFQIVVDDADVVPGNFSTIVALDAFVSSKLQHV